MKLWEALKINHETGRMIRPAIERDGGGLYEFLPAGNWSFTVFHAVALDWEVEPAKVEVTREQVIAALSKVRRISIGPGHCKSDDELDNEFFKELGL